MAIADWLLTWRVVGEDMSCLSSESKSLSQMASLVAWAPAMYSASVLERATVGCFLELQLMVPPPKVKM
jgi:hypothetical protein